MLIALDTALVLSDLEFGRDRSDLGKVQFSARQIRDRRNEWKPSVPVLSMRGVDEDGFVFYTSLEGRKG